MVLLSSPLKRSCFPPISSVATNCSAHSLGSSWSLCCNCRAQIAQLMYVGLENTIKGAGTLLHLFSAKSESISSAPKSTHLHLSANSVIFPLLLAVINSRTLQWALLLLWLHYFYKIDYSPLTQRQFAQKNYWWLKPRYTCQNKLLEYLLRGSSPSSSGRLSATVICTAWGLEVGRQCWWRPCDAMWQLCSTGGCVGVIWNLVFPCTLPMLHQMCAQSNFVDRGGWFAHWMQSSGAPGLPPIYVVPLGLHVDAGVSWELDGDVGSSLVAVRWGGTEGLLLSSIV